MAEITLQDIIQPENLVYEKSKLLTEKPFHYCPGCGHGTVHRIIAEVLEELGVDDRTIGVSPVGCAVMAYDYFDVDFVEAAHGRAPACATGIKRVWPDKVVFSYQRHDRWSDGSYHPCGHEDRHHALRPYASMARRNSEQRFPAPDHPTAGPAAWHPLRHPSGCVQRRRRA